MRRKAAVIPVHPAEVALPHLGLHVLGQEARLDGVGGDHSQVLLLESQDVARDLQLVRQVDAEQPGVVGVDGDAGSFKEEATGRMLGQGGDRVGPFVRRRAHLQRDLPLDDELGHRGVAGDAHPVAEPAYPQDLDGLPGVLGPPGFAVVGGEGDARLPDRRQYAGEDGGREVHLVVGEVEAHQLLPVAEREVHRPLRRLDPVRATDDGDQPHRDVEVPGPVDPGQDRLHRPAPFELVRSAHEVG